MYTQPEFFSGYEYKIKAFQINRTDSFPLKKNFLVEENDPRGKAADIERNQKQQEWQICKKCKQALTL